ncbi:LysM peptidoglycan-binding domain-containing protein [Sulfitobacter sp. MF3-043]|uniref:LysM peptidoglycan-binding domain-containing protein n=1 Tax=Sulfitobacter sediminivivens TaxID=3252902 RepID=UPI0036DB7BCF
MSMHGLPDPTSPPIIFKSYDVPETLDENAAYRRAMRFNGTIAAVSLVAVLTFVLGIMSSVQFAGPSEPVASIAFVAPTDPTPSDLEIFVAASLEQEVTRQQSPDLLSPTGDALRNDPQFPNLEASILQGLMPIRTVGKLTEDERKAKSREALAIVSRNKLRMLREGVLAGVYTVSVNTENAQDRIVLKTINADLTSKTMANLLQKAADEGRIELPASLNTADGNVDMDTLLFNLVQTSLAEDGTEEGAEAAREMSRRAFAASRAKTREIEGKRIYVVEPGDSLAYLSLQFYGRPSDYHRIFQANRPLLKSPDLIQIGQRLIIPG